MPAKNNRPFELYVFDWDGTCMDTTHFIAKAIQAAAVETGCAEPSYETAESVIGLGHGDMMKIAVPDCPESKYDDFASAYWRAYIRQENTIPGLHPELEPLLSNMKNAGLWLGIATGKSRNGLNRVLGKTGAAKYFAATKTADESFSKPAPDMLLELSDECCVPLERMVMVGDAVHDLQMAANAGVAAVGVTWGAARRPALEALKPLAVADTVPELARALGVSDLLP